MKRLIVCLLLAGFLGTMAFRKSAQAPYPVPEGWPQPVYDFTKNPPDKEKMVLGRRLFYDPTLSRDSTISCASCHLSFTAFAHTDHDLSHGIDGRIGTRNAPALMNLAWHSSFMWDGAINHLDMQPLAPISDSMEMHEDIGRVLAKLQSTDRYPALFYKAFGDSTIRTADLLKSLSQFMLMLVSANSKYDQVKGGADNFNDQETRGYRLFQQHCADCHTEPLFTNGVFENNGLPPDETLRDPGRMRVTGDSSDYLKFKVPTLRNIALSYPYMHDGRFKTLNQVLNHYIRGIQPNPTLNPKLQHGIPLGSNDKADLIAFLLTLTDQSFVRDTSLAFIRE
jgi:cytochrome c peroxidase